MNNKFGICTVCGTNDYAWGCIRFIQRAKYLNKNLDFFIVCPEFLSAKTFKLFEEQNVKYKIINDSELQTLYNNCKNPIIHKQSRNFTIFNLLLPFYLIEYDAVFVFEGDMLWKEDAGNNCLNCLETLIEQKKK